MRVAFLGGGTGGHLAPGIGVAEILRADGHETLFLVAGRDVERAMLEPRALPLSELFDGGGGRPALHHLGSWVRATRRLRGEVDRFDPDVIVVLGGWVALPAVWSGFGRRPTVLIESNARPGRVQRLLGKRVDHACLSVDAPGMPRGRLATHVTGTPTPHLEVPSRADAAARFGLAAGARTLLVTGGSQGARDVNELVPSLCAVLAARRERWQVLHVTGTAARSRPAEGEAVFERRGDPTALVPGRDVPVVEVPFVHDMASAWALADVAVCRAGAGTVAELASTGTPSVLVPYPHHADRHQAHNGQRLVDAGAAFMVPADDPSGRRTAAEFLKRVVEDLPAMSGRAAALACPDAAREVAEVVGAAARAAGATAWQVTPRAGDAGPFDGPLAEPMDGPVDDLRPAPDDRGDAAEEPGSARW